MAFPSDQLFFNRLVGNGLQLCFVFRARFANCEAKTETFFITMDGVALRRIERQDIPIEWSDEILDIGVHMNSTEVDFLFANKRAVYTGFLESEENLDASAEDQSAVSFPLDFTNRFCEFHFFSHLNN
ncbi:MAG: hypothetical protein BJ554DRAFT_3077 [Olpidium bornovanus]|uniref:Uncharacterized protein n=1 Tax=Olpidium bornovanus TaxID=278681 RepID=A0A8H7ZQ41_9FUNG|nr:MAG: hypothetical protein BJ554DRAFT_3077 [Olpidium bornovanus]